MTVFFPRRTALLVCLWITWTKLTFHQATAQVDYDDYSDYVKEVLEEDASNQHENEYYHEDDYYERQKEQQREAQQQRQADEERLAQEEADRVAAERERSFQAELDRMSVEQQKAAMQQKKKDARIVRSVLNASLKQDLYKVLGIRNWSIKIPSRTIGLAGFSFQIPGITIKEVTMKDIRKAYRTRAMAVHPDKNKDGRAQEAFIAVEESASILSDNFLREQYDKELRLSQKEKRQSQLKLVAGFVNYVRSTVIGVFKASQMVLGPFATPVIIICLLLV